MENQTKSNYSLSPSTLELLEFMEIKEHVVEAIASARVVQEFLHGQSNTLNDLSSSRDIWVAVFQKRVDKIAQIDFNNSSSKVELRKRVLQQLTLSIKLLELIGT